MGKFEVTVGQYRRFVNDTGYVMGNCSVYNKGRWKDHPHKNWKNPGFSQGNQSPVVCVNHDDVKAYAKWISRKTGKNYRLPSYTEWWYVSIGGKNGKFTLGDKSTPISSYAWYKKNSGKKTHTVGRKSPNSWGFYDMFGNVSEWCEDNHSFYHDFPLDGSANYEVLDEGMKVMAGYDWNFDIVDRVVSSIRGFPAHGRGTFIGFRLVHD